MYVYINTYLEEMHGGVSAWDGLVRGRDRVSSCVGRGYLVGGWRMAPLEKAVGAQAHTWYSIYHAAGFFVCASLTDCEASKRRARSQRCASSCTVREDQASRGRPHPIKLNMNILQVRPLVSGVALSTSCVSGVGRWR